MIHISAQPVRVRDFIVWAGSDQQLIGTVRSDAVTCGGFMFEIGEAALQAADDFRIMALPNVVSGNKRGRP